MKRFFVASVVATLVFASFSVAIAQRPTYLVKAMLFKKNITGARDRWDLVINEDGAVTVNAKDAEALPADLLAKLKEAVAATDFASMMKTKSTEGYPSSKGGMDHEYFVQNERKRYAVFDFMHVIDFNLPFFKLMADIEKRYKPTFGRQGRGG